MMIPDYKQPYQTDYNYYVRTGFLKCDACSNFDRRVYNLLISDTNIHIVTGCDNCGESKTYILSKQKLKTMSDNESLLKYPHEARILRLGYYYRALWTSDEQYKKYIKWIDFC